MTTITCKLKENALYKEKEVLFMIKYHENDNNKTIIKYEFYFNLSMLYHDSNE